MKSTNAILLSGSIYDLTMALKRASEDLISAEKFLAEIKPEDDSRKIDWTVNDAKNVVRDATNSVLKAQTNLTGIINLLKKLKELVD